MLDPHDRTLGQVGATGAANLGCTGNPVITPRRTRLDMPCMITSRSPGSSSVSASQDETRAAMPSYHSPPGGGRV